jgi:AcrR family transcriptional regulator
MDRMGQPQRVRNTTRQREAGQASRAETRRRLVQAAGELFAERGYAATTVSAIAERAGVSLQTLYLAAQGKRQLLRAYMEATVAASPAGLDQDYVDRLKAMVAASGGHDSAARIRAVAHVYRLIAERSAAGWHLYRDAAAMEPEIAADWDALQSLRRRTFRGLLEGIPDEDLRAELTFDDAVDTAWAIASPQTYDVLVRHGGYTLDTYESWVAGTLVAALLHPRPTGGSTPA